jgi:hypothetical protein
MLWDIEEIRDCNPPEKGQARSRLDNLLRMGIVSPEALCDLAQEIDERGPGYVGALFQLPYQVGLNTDWEALPTSPDSVRALVKFRPNILTMDDFGTFELKPWEASSAREYDGVAVTQGMALFHVWGKRQRPHQRYVSAQEHTLGRDTIVVPQSESWIDNRPITYRDYEINFARRLRIEISEMLRAFLPAYSLVSRSETPVLRWVYGFVPMLTAGHLASTNWPVPVARYLFSGKPTFEAPMVKLEDLRIALKTPHRELGRFESQLIAMDRLRREGEVALSFVGTTALLEWLLGTVILRAGMRAPKNFNDRIAHPEVAFLPPELRSEIDRARNRRNALIHGAPPHRRSLKSSDEGQFRSRELVLEEGISSEEVRILVETAFSVFRLANVHLASRSGGQ